MAVLRRQRHADDRAALRRFNLSFFPGFGQVKSRTDCPQLQFQFDSLQLETDSQQPRLFYMRSMDLTATPFATSLEEDVLLRAGLSRIKVGKTHKHDDVQRNHAAEPRAQSRHHGFGVVQEEDRVQGVVDHAAQPLPPSLLRPEVHTEVSATTYLLINSSKKEVEPANILEAQYKAERRTILEGGSRMCLLSTKDVGRRSRCCCF